MWEAVWIIIVADIIMSLDNVIAIAGAAHGNMVLVVFGIGLSIPLVVAGSGILAQLMNRFQWIIWIGGGVLGYVAGEMIARDSLVADRPGVLGQHRAARTRHRARRGHHLSGVVAVTARGGRAPRTA